MLSILVASLLCLTALDHHTSAFCMKAHPQQHLQCKLGCHCGDIKDLGNVGIRVVEMF